MGTFIFLVNVAFKEFRSQQVLHELFRVVKVGLEFGELGEVVGGAVLSLAFHLAHDALCVGFAVNYNRIWVSDSSNKTMKCKNTQCNVVSDHRALTFVLHADLSSKLTRRSGARSI
jgi:hypothetical protein